MRIELQCPRCTFAFTAPADAPASEALERMSDEGPWVALGDGETFEDRIFTALTSQGAIHCPRCGGGVPLNEETVVELAHELLAQW